MNDRNLTGKMKENYRFFGIGTALYAGFYALCLYKNGGGIAFTFFIAGSLWFYCLCMRKLEVSLKKGSIFYLVTVMLLAVSTFITGDGRIIAMNKTGIFFLTASFLLHQFFEDKNWSFFKYMENIIKLPFVWIAKVHRPFVDFHKKENEKQDNNALYVVLGLLVGIPLLIVVWMLLCAADAAFARISRNIFGNLNFGSGFQIVFMVLAAFFVTYGIFAYLAERSLSDEAREKTPAEALPAIIVLIPLTVLYMVFCWIQIFCLFGGNFNMQGMTYAEYARRGFFDLLAVCILNLILVQAGYGFFKKNKVLDITMTVMSACTYIMIASSAFRMIQYVKHYNLTFLRVFVLWFLVVLTVLLTGVIISIFKRSFPLFRFSMVVVTVCYLLLSFAHVDYWIASYNLHRGETAGTASYHMGHTDYSYLRYMSSDAALAFREYIEDGGKEAASADEGVWYGEDGEREYFVPEEDWLTYYTKRMDTRYEKMGIRGFNLSQYIANKVLHGN